MKIFFMTMYLLLIVSGPVWAGDVDVKVYDCKISFGESYKKTFLVDQQNALIGVFSAQIALWTDGKTIRGLIEDKAFQGQFPEAQFASSTEGTGEVRCSPVRSFSYILREDDPNSGLSEYFSLDSKLNGDHLPNTIYPYSLKSSDNFCYLGDQQESLHALSKAFRIQGIPTDPNTIQFIYPDLMCINPQPYYEGSVRCDGYKKIIKRAIFRRCASTLVPTL